MGRPAAGVGRDTAGVPIGPGPNLTVHNHGVPCVTPGCVVGSQLVSGPGSLTVRVGGLPACRAGDTTTSGVPIVAVSTVWIGG